MSFHLRNSWSVVDERSRIGGRIEMVDTRSFGIDNKMVIWDKLFEGACLIDWSLFRPNLGVFG